MTTLLSGRPLCLISRWGITAGLMLIFVSDGIGQFRETSAERWNGSALFQSPENAGEKKSVLLAVGLSLVLPGMGEWYSDNAETAQYFFAVDGALWITYTGFAMHGGWLRADARLFARERAGADFAGKDDKFDVDVGNYPSVEEYNEAKLRNREFDLLYEDARYAWNWRLESDRLRFRNLRIRSQEMSRSAEFIVGALVINRIISAFSAWRSAAAYNRERAGMQSWYLTAEIQGGLEATHGVGLKLRAPL